MRFFDDLSVEKKLKSIFSLVCIFIIMIGTEGILSAVRLNNLAEFGKTRNTIISYTAISFLCIFFVAYFLIKNIMYPLNKIKNLAERFFTKA